MSTFALLKNTSFKNTTHFLTLNDDILCVSRTHDRGGQGGGWQVSVLHVPPVLLRLVLHVRTHAREGTPAATGQERIPHVRGHLQQQQAIFHVSLLTLHSIQ